MRVHIGKAARPIAHYWAGKYGGIGDLISPNGIAQFTPYPWLPYIIDNGAYSVWAAGETWTAVQTDKFLATCNRLLKSPVKPSFIVVPDVVCDASLTLEKWYEFSPLLKKYGVPLAFVVQDGMTIDLLPDCDVVFIGGSTKWKWETLEYWCHHFPRVHVGRVNEFGQLSRAYHAGAESVDGTGYFRGDKRQLDGLEKFLAGMRQLHLPI